MMRVSGIQENGYAIIPDVVSPSALRSLEQRIANSSLARSRAGVRHFMQDPEVAGFANRDELRALAAEALGETAIPFRATLFDKSPDSNWLVVWHQDTALPLRKRIDAKGWGPWSTKEGVLYAHAPAKALSRVAAVRIHLDDSDAHNGPLRVLPGTHTKGVLSDDEIHTLSKHVVPVDCTVPAGGVVVMLPLVVHASSKSTSDAPRRVLHIEYAASLQLDAGLELAIA